MARERNEGFGDLHAMVVQWSAQTKVKGLKYTLALGYFLPKAFDLLMLRILP